MKFFTKEVIEDDSSRDQWNEAFRLRHIGLLKMTKVFHGRSTS